MWRKAVLQILLLVSGVAAFATPQSLKLADVPKVMERLFSFHIENKSLTPVIIRRSMKIYIEQFDPEKAYVLAQEIVPYLNLTDQKAAEIVARLNRGDYSDYLALTTIFQRSVRRAEAIRSLLAQELLEEQLSEANLPMTAPTKYASSEEELVLKQRNRMVRFFFFQQSRTRIESMERKAKVFSLFEKKVRRSEANVLYLTPEGESLTKDKVEHYLATKILKSFAKSLDTHTSFYSPEEAYEMRMSLEKQFDGVGVVLSESIDGVIIADLIKGSPAEQNGKIKANDLLTEIDGKSVEKISFEEVLELLKKKDRGEIILGFKRVLETGKETSFRVSLRKRPIVMNDERIETSYEKFGNGVIGKIALHSFYESGDGVSSEKDMRDAIRSFQQRGEVHGLILDLRENAGGFLSQAVKVAGLFISNGVVVISKYGKGEIHYLRNIVGKQFFSGPVVILTSKMSASAAEIVAQALQDYGVAVVVGDERTFGKGSIQFQNVTDEKAEHFFKVTVGRYYTVSGRSTQIDGVIADIHVPTQYAPYNIGERFLEYPLPPDSVEPAYIDSLTDLDVRTQMIFQKRYLPFLQRVVPFWKKTLPQLKKNSAARITRNPDFQMFMRRMEKIKARQTDAVVNTIDEQIHIGLEDLQMMEAFNIVKDMIYIDAQSRPKEAALAPTGSDQ
jgi:carboxyl-terminal processing protease